MGYVDREKQRAYQRAWLAARKAAWIAEHGPCARCGSAKKLEVDHIDPSTKVSHSVWSWSKERREAELAKCQVLCGKCHKAKSRAAREPTHGTHSRYAHRRCRCAKCKKAHRITNARYRKKKGS